MSPAETSEIEASWRGLDIRSRLISGYEVPRFAYSQGIGGRFSRKTLSAVRWAGEVGVWLWYGNTHPGRKRKVSMDVPKMIALWKEAIVGLAVAHDKVESDKFEASIENCLTPLLTAPVKELRALAKGLLASLREDPRVPFLVWRAYEVWVDQIEKAPDEGVKLLKRDLAQQIVDLVEEDAKKQLPEAMVRALMWRDPTKLEEVKAVVEKEKAAGRGVRLKGRESCLFLECGGTEEEPAVCVQV